jgi:hypothetical protein
MLDATQSESKRLDNLEQSVRWLKRLLATAGLIIAVLAGMVGFLLVQSQRLPYVTRAGAFPSEITARRFLVVDQDGRTTASLTNWGLAGCGKREIFERIGPRVSGLSDR